MHSQYRQIEHPPPPSSSFSSSDDVLNDDSMMDYEYSSHGSPIHATATTTTHLESRQRNRAVVLFTITTILLFADQNLMSPNLTAIAHDFGFTDTQRDSKLGGEIALAFFCLGAPASFVVGLLGDSSRVSRVWLFAWTVGLGEGACALTFFTTNYMQLYICRAITGFSMGGALPLIYSILGDLYSAEQRHMISSLVGIGTGIGIALGQGIAGFLGPSLGWRLPFLVVSVPALICAAAVLMTVAEPERGGMERAVRDHRHFQNDSQLGRSNSAMQEDDDCSARSSASRSSSMELAPLDLSEATNNNAPQLVRRGRKGQSKDDHGLGCHALDPDMLFVDETPNFSDQHWSTFKTLMKTPTVVFSLLQGAPGCVPWGIVNTYLNDYLSENRNMSVEFATTTVLLFGFGNFLGMILGGIGGSFLYTTIDKRAPALFAGSAAILSCFPLWMLLNIVDNTSHILFIALIAISSGICSGVTGPIIKATLQNVTHPQARGQAFALFNTFDDFGRGLGPVFVAVLIQKMGGRTPAFNVGVLGWMLCGIFNLCVFWTVVRDEDKLQQSIAEGLDGRNDCNRVQAQPQQQQPSDTGVV